MSDRGMVVPTFDVTARKVHQWAMVAIVLVAFLLGTPGAAVLLALAGAVMLVGRFWWPADIFRQVTWRFLEPAGLLRRREVHEDHETRRVARVLGGAAWMVAAALLLLHLPIVAWVVAFAIVIMVALDAAADFCALCFVVALVRR
ncbi:MAG TPA: DUF4395 family protein [Candidatus Dormibacteraeota bacterium]|nr:DUF4395 family protein [Candidatus Dormibacteraeota bacterium]